AYFEKVRKQYIDGGNLHISNTSWLPQPNRVFEERSQVREEMELTYRLYVFPHEEQLFTIGVQGYNLQDTTRWDNW
ncbi:MAG: hypothetical protein ACPF9D_01640, partial [Owenweeksia sp.]